MASKCSLLDGEDEKLQLYRAIDKSCGRLTSILDNYQNSLFMFANEENALGIFLKECGKQDRTAAGKIMSAVGKSLIESSQQRICIYMPLVRFYQRVETFYSRAVKDTSKSVNKLDKKRSQYRSSLSRLKNISDNLDPDDFLLLNKFRRTQNQVRNEKKAYDSMHMDVVQKVDLLTASRCNLVNQAVVPYQTTLLETFERNYHNFKSVEDIIKKIDIYEYKFETLKELNSLQLDDLPRQPQDEAQTVEEPPEEDLLLKESPLIDTSNNNDSKVQETEAANTSTSLIDVELSDSQNNNSNQERRDSKSLENVDTMELLETLFGKTPAVGSSELF